jgi:hypothetical protein
MECVELWDAIDELSVPPAWPPEYQQLVAARRIPYFVDADPMAKSARNGEPP